MNRVKEAEKHNPKPTNPANEMGERRNFWLAIAALVIVPFILYWPSMHAPFIFDDIGYIVENPSIGKFEIQLNTKNLSDDLLALKASRPLTFLSFDLNHRLSGFNPLSYHLFNVLVHILCTIMIFLISRKLFASAYNHPLNFIPFVIAFIFSVHPVNTEVVSYISPRSESLATFFYLVSLYTFIQSPSLSFMTMVSSLVCFSLALLSKETATTLPVIILTLDFLFLCNGQINEFRKKIYKHAIYWVVLGLYIAARYSNLGSIGDAAKITLATWTSWTYFLTQLWVVLKYICLLVFPLGQSIDHFIRPIQSPFDPRIILSLLAYGVFIFSEFLILKKEKLAIPIVLFSFIWFFVTLLPTSSFLPINDAMAERRVYLPQFGFICLAIISYKVFFLFKPKILISIMTIYLIFLLSVTWSRNKKFSDPILLWKEAVLRYPSNYRALNNLGYSYYQKKDYDNAFEYFQKAAHANPKYLGPNFNMGNVCLDLGDWQRAQIYFKKEIEMNFQSKESYNGLGLAFYKMGKDKEAEQNYLRAIEIDPLNYIAYGNLGNVYQREGKIEEAYHAYQKALQINSALPAIYIGLANLFFAQGKLNEALKSMESASLLDPENPIITTAIEKIQSKILKGD